MQIPCLFTPRSLTHYNNTYFILNKEKEGMLKLVEIQ